MVAFLWPQKFVFQREKAESQWEMKVGRIWHLFPGGMICLACGFSSLPRHLALTLHVQRSSDAAQWGWDHTLHASPLHLSKHLLSCHKTDTQTGATSLLMTVVPLKSSGLLRRGRATVKSCWQLSPEDGMRHLLSGNLEMMSALILYVLSSSSSCFCPSRSKHHRLKSAGAALILLGACELSMSFSLDSLKGSLSFPLGSHCLLAASSAGQITARYLHFECIWEGSTVSCTVLDPSAEKREVLSAPERWRKSDRRAAGALNLCQCISPPMGFVSRIAVL